MPARLKMIVAYDGAPFSGWQSQADRNAIQDHLEKALGQICSAPVRVHGAGRTDAGVHALAQCAHADLPERRYDAGRWRAALNGILPASIRIMQCRFVSNAFHARFSAKGKIYRYRIWNDEVLPPLENGRAWHIREPLERQAMAAAIQLFVGRHDFGAFAANRGAAVADTVRTIRRAHFRNAGAMLAIDFEGDGFLYKMVRLMVGALVQTGLGKVTAREIRKSLRGSGKRGPIVRMVAPASGLFLVRVRY